MTEESKFTILWHSVSPFVESGYGRVTRNVTTRLVQYGFKVIVSAYYGMEPGGLLNYNGVYCVASKEGPFGIISAQKYARQFRPHISLLHTDFWAFCLDANTEVLTPDGWRYIVDVDIGDLVATLNLSTGKIEYQPVENKIVFEAQTYRLKTRQLELLVTGNHRMVVRCGKSFRLGSKWKLKEITSLRSKTLWYTPVSGEYVNLRKYRNTSLMWLLGFIVAEGSFRKYDLRIYQSLKHDRIIKKLRKVLEELEIPWHEWISKEGEIYGYKTAPVIQFQIKANEAKELMRHFSDVKKKIPNENVLYCSSEEFEAFIGGLVDGDGVKERSGALQVYLKEKELADWIQRLCILHGWRCIISKRKGKDIYLLTLTKRNYATFNGRKIKKEGRKRVVGLTVENGTLVVRYNGRHIVTGNSEFPKRMPYPVLYGPMDHVNYPEEIVNFTKLYWRIIPLCKFQDKILREQMGISEEKICQVVPHGVDINVYKPLNKKEIKIKNNLEGKFVFGTVNANCFDEDTEILTRDGWKRWNELDYNTEILTLSNGRLEYERPENIIVQYYRGPMYRLKTKYLDFLVTPEHKMYVKRRVISKRNKRLYGKFAVFSQYERVPAYEIFGKQRWYKKDGGLWTGREENSFILPSYKDRPSREIRMDDFLKLLGYYITEGNCKDWEVVIKQTKHLEKMFGDILRCGLNARKYSNRISIYDVQLVKWLKREVGNRAEEKRIPQRFLELSPRQLRILLDAIVLGDGWKTSSSFAVGTSSHRLAGQLQEIGLKLGYACDISVKIEESKRKGKYPFYVVHFNTTVKEVQNRPSTSEGPETFVEEWQLYEGIVWCVTVPSHLVYVRRNGKVAWSGQSDKEMGGGRKSWGPMMKAMRLFLDNNPDVKEEEIVWICHTNPTDPRGFPLLGMAHKYRLDSICKFAHPDIFATALSDRQMVELYNSFDVFLGASKREGFGMTILEAMACGVPVIAHDFASMTELVKGHGWLVKSVARDLNMELTPILAETAIPDVYDLAAKIEEAYFKDKKREKYGKLSRKFAVKYNWDDIVINGWLPVLGRIKEDYEELLEEMRENQELLRRYGFESPSG